MISKYNIGVLNTIKSIRITRKLMVVMISAATTLQIILHKKEQLQGVFKIFLNKLIVQ